MRPYQSSNSTATDEPVSKRVPCSPCDLRAHLDQRQWTVRHVLWSRLDITPELADVERAMRDRHWAVRVAVFERPDLELTTKQIALGLAAAHAREPL